MTSPKNIPSSFTQQLRQLRRQLLGWTALRGAARWVTALLAMLLLDMVIDRTFGMDWAQRAIVLVLMIVCAVGWFAWRVIRPLLMLPSDQALVYEIERKHPELRESLLAATQFGATPHRMPVGASAELVNATIDRGFDAAAAVDFGSVLNAKKRSSYLWWLIIGGVVLAAIAIGVTQTGFLNTWFQRNVLLGDAQWPRQTYLQIAGAKDGLLQLPRGADHRQIVEVTEESRTQDVLVSLEIENGGSRTIQSMKSTGRLAGREHLFVFHNVSAPFRFRASGGDDVTEWVDVALVEPPSVIALSLTANLPEYTAADPRPLVGSGPHVVLAGSRLDVVITTNKELTSAVVQHDGVDLPLVAADESNKQFSTVLPNGGDGSNEPLKGGDYQFVLTDVTGLGNVRKSKFAIAIKEDKPPQVRAKLLGISGLVVPNAVLPTSFEAVDDYGVQALRFACQYRTAEMTDSDESIERSIDFAMVRPNAGLPRTKQIDEVEVLDLATLPLQPGASFRFQVEATDFQPVNADATTGGTNNVGRSAELLLRIVSAEELRADLLRREIEQRQAFLNARDKQLEMTGELESWMARWNQPDQTDAFRASQDSDLIRLLRDQKGVGTLVDRVATRFEEFLVEVQNNRLDESEAAAGIAEENRLMTRFDRGIIQPIRELDRNEIAQATRELDGCRLAVSTGKGLPGAVAQTLDMQRQVLERMKMILAAMTSSEDYQELVNRMLEVKADQQRLKQDIEKSLEPKNIFDDDDLENVFDD